MKIVFLLASISQPRCIKRIQGFISRGYPVEIYGFNRGVYNINANIDGCSIIDLGLLPSGKGYISKFIYSYRMLKELFRKNKDSEILYYVFSFDLALLCKLFSYKRYVYEISDIVYTYFSIPFLLNVFKRIDKRLIKGSLLTVMTSKGFMSYFFESPLSNIIIQPNKVNIILEKSNRELYNRTTKIRFSYVGAFRYPNTVFRLAKVIGEKYPHFEFIFWGDSILTELAVALSNQYENVKYMGAFKNPDDLTHIYQNIDVVVACYDTQTLNERIAEPNKLYEALFFKRPIIVSENTYLATRVNEYKCGFTIDATSDEKIINFLDNLDTSILEKIKKNIDLVPLSDIVDDDSQEIVNYIKKNI